MVVTLVMVLPSAVHVSKRLTRRGGPQREARLALVAAEVVRPQVLLRQRVSRTVPPRPGNVFMTVPSDVGGSSSPSRRRPQPVSGSICATSDDLVRRAAAAGRVSSAVRAISTDSLPPPEVLAREIVDDLEAALAEFTAVAEGRGKAAANRTT
jgi:hypothetical protein